MTPEPPAGARCFLDANILVYYVTQIPPFSAPSRDFLERIQRGELIAATSPMMISEALHRIMLSEVQKRFGVPKPLAHVQSHPDVIGQLSTYPLAATAIARLKMQVLQMDATLWQKAASIAATYSLLTDDASTVALMQRESIPYLATNDDDFDSVPGLMPCKPR